ncbi:hypothetical protein K469DRAFT_557928, partial [Zopfia rhizophila CBS 207.26]
LYYNLSDIQDKAGRVDSHPWRIEAEDMALSRCKIVSVTPQETTSNTKAVLISSNITAGTASATTQFSLGRYNLPINYYDRMKGKASYEVYISEALLGKCVTE